MATINPEKASVVFADQLQAASTDGAEFRVMLHKAIGVLAAKVTDTTRAVNEKAADLVLADRAARTGTTVQEIKDRIALKLGVRSDALLSSTVLDSVEVPDDVDAPALPADVKP